MKTVKIHSEPITLGQLLKYANIASSGGEVKHFLSTYIIHVDEQLENRRGRKLYRGMVVDIKGVGMYKLE